MNDDKTKEQSSEQHVPQETRRTLRSTWAKLQCIGLLRRHHLRHKTRKHMDVFHHNLLQSGAAMQVGETLYALGYSTEYVFVRMGRAVRRAAVAAAHWAQGLFNDLLTTAFPGARRALHDSVEPFVLLFRGTVSLVSHAHKVRKENGFGASVVAANRFLVNGVRNNIRLLPRMAAYVLPVCALACMSLVVHFTMQRPYALQVQVDGTVVGYVANESVFNSALEDVQERINYAGAENDAKFTVEPTYNVAISHDVMDENDVADAILKNSSDQITEGTALYLDGELTAVCKDGTALQGYLDSLLEPYEDQEDATTTVGFNKEVTLENGIYFNDSLQDVEEVENAISGVQQQEQTYTVQTGDTLWTIAQKNNLTFRELCLLNIDFKGEQLTENSLIQAGDTLVVTRQEAALEVRITKIETWDEEIAYTTETTKSSSLNSGVKRVEQQGVNGVRTITAQCVYDTDGNQLSQQILSSVVTKEPVTEKVTVGTKKTSTATSYITGSGQFIWPVPGYRYCSRWYGSGHKGVDICAAAGTPIYASAGGTVTKAGYNKAGAGTGYGYSVIISHGSGYSTVYAHCLSLAVSAGQTVRQGQLIGYVGSTGRSSGNHCHFEIRLNGTYIQPQNVFSRSKYK